MAIGVRFFHPWADQPHIWMSHVTHTIELCHTYEWVMSHLCVCRVLRRVRIWMRMQMRMCHTHEWVMPHIWMSHVTHMNKSCRTHEWVMSHTWMSHVTHMNESRHTHEWVMSHSNAYTQCGISHKNSTYEWFVCHICAGHVLRRVHIWIWHATYLNESCHTHEWVMSHT